MKRPFSILDLQCDVEGNSVKSEFVKYTDDLEERIKKVLILLDKDLAILTDPKALHEWWMDPKNDMDPRISRDNGKTWVEMTVKDMEETQEEQWRENIKMLFSRIKGTLDPYPFYLKESINNQEVGSK